MNQHIFETCRNHFPKNLWQSLPWAKFQKDLDKKVFFFGEDECIALGIIQTLPFGFHYLEIPRGPLGTTDTRFWEEVSKVARENHCIFTRISPKQRVHDLPQWHCTSDAQHHPTDTLILDLTLPEEEILKQMKPKGRYNIRVAQRKFVNVFESDNIDAFYALLEETTSRDKFSPHPKSYYQTMMQSLGDKVKLYLASIKNENNEEKIIAGAIFTFLDETCTYYYGASSDENREDMAPYLIQWTAISYAKETGFEQYDFLGIAPENAKNHPLEGVTRFKKQFGGKHVSYPKAKDIIHNVFIYMLYRLYKLLKNNW